MVVFHVQRWGTGQGPAVGAVRVFCGWKLAVGGPGGRGLNLEHRIRAAGRRELCCPELMAVTLGFCGDEV